MVFYPEKHQNHQKNLQNQLIDIGRNKAVATCDHVNYTKYEFCATGEQIDKDAEAVGCMRACEPHHSRAVLPLRGGGVRLSATQ